MLYAETFSSPRRVCYDSMVLPAKHREKELMYKFRKYVIFYVFTDARTYMCLFTEEQEHGNTTLQPVHRH